jgi:hypothetical protein
MTIKNDWFYVAVTTSLVVAMLFTETALSADSIFVGAEKVEFESVSFAYTPSPFKVKQAKKLGKILEVKTEPSISVTAYLARPNSEEPRPAIVLLHTCAGMSEFEEMWSDRLVTWGYVVLTVDSFTPRGVEYVCTGQQGATRGAVPWMPTARNGISQLFHS